MYVLRYIAQCAPNDFTNFLRYVLAHNVHTTFTCVTTLIFEILKVLDITSVISSLAK